MKELSGTSYFDKTLSNMVVLKALGPHKLHFSFDLAIFSYFGEKLLSAHILKNPLIDPFQQLYNLDETVENKMWAPFPGGGCSEIQTRKEKIVESCQNSLRAKLVAGCQAPSAAKIIANYKNSEFCFYD